MNGVKMFLISCGLTANCIWWVFVVSAAMTDSVGVSDGAMAAMLGLGAISFITLGFWGEHLLTLKETS